MKILVDPDTVPSTLAECLDNVRKNFDEEDIKELQEYKKNPFIKEKIGAAIFLKSVWSLTDDESLLVKWFKEEYDLDNADDISALVLHCLYREARGNPTETRETAATLLKNRNKRKRKVEPEL